eukprot:6456291-Amphidinium_carterae.2
MPNEAVHAQTRPKPNFLFSHGMHAGSSTGAVVYHGLEGILRDMEALTSEALYPAVPVPGTRRVTRLHFDCASEFTGRVAEMFALRHVFLVSIHPIKWQS